MCKHGFDMKKNKLGYYKALLDQEVIFWDFTIIFTVENCLVTYVLDVPKPNVCVEVACNDVATIACDQTAGYIRSVAFEGGNEVAIVVPHLDSVVEVPCHNVLAV